MIDDKNGNKVIKLSTAVAFFAVFIAFGCLVVAGSSQESFVGQFSFASTITSIILSVIAIWMSISGDRTNNEIKDKMINATNRLDCVTCNIEKINSTYENKVIEQIRALEGVDKKLQEMGGDLTDVKKQLFNTIAPRKNQDNTEYLLNNFADNEIAEIYIRSISALTQKGRCMEYKILKEFKLEIENNNDINSSSTIKNAVERSTEDKLIRAVFIGRISTLLGIEVLKEKNIPNLITYLEKHLDNE
ncbi:hypothetical protein [Lacrimispora defluvii]|uniref:Uncharacterized protein n=1 Tax=Lacrimispora defluvii TaxID=2719233 RepID=A0ABX1VY16_9FIRM|nr:hypothetical protein [Lacrimispora defluvii]NNJ32659.1 hypothetical protein [Lacrimispora defluvii]